LSRQTPTPEAADPVVLHERPRNWKTYMVYTVFTVYFDPPVVHNLFKLCYPLIS